MYKGKKKDYFIFKRDELIYDMKAWKTSFLGFSLKNSGDYKVRIEYCKNFDYLIFIEIVQQYLPAFFFFNCRYIYNIFFLDLICSYKGYRHNVGLPVRGQRTWTNARTTYKANIAQRQFKIFFFKKFLGVTNVAAASQFFLAEQVNLLWKIQWESEWKEARKKHKKLKQEKKGAHVGVDLQAMSRFDVGGFTKKKGNITTSGSF